LGSEAQLLLRLLLLLQCLVGLRVPRRKATGGCDKLAHTQQACGKKEGQEQPFVSLQVFSEA
jgi:hypothetical protein